MIYGVRDPADAVCRICGRQSEYSPCEECQRRLDEARSEFNEELRNTKEE